MVPERFNQDDDSQLISWLYLLLSIELAAIFFFVPAGRFHLSFFGYQFTTGYDAYKLFPIPLLTWLYWRWKQGRRSWPQSDILLPMWTFFLTALLASLFSPDPYEALTEVLETGLYIGFFILLIDRN